MEDEGEFGVWTGPGVFRDESTGDYKFNPSLAGLGTHVIQFDIVVNGSPGEAEQTYRVIPSADVLFENVNSCVEDAIEFNDLTFIAEDPNRNVPDENTNIIEYRWTFGDGQTVTGSPGVSISGAPNTTGTYDNPFHKYSDANSYVVMLEVTTEVIISNNSYSCSSSYTSTIEIGAKPQAAFNWADVCNGDFTTFTDASLNNGAVINNYTWDFNDGNGTISGAPGVSLNITHGNGSVTQGVYNQPEHQFASEGVYDVELTIGTEKGCFDTFSRKVGILPTYTGGTFPYEEDFDATNGDWVASADLREGDPLLSASDTSWVWQAVAGAFMNPDGRANSWWTGSNVVGENTYYYNNENSWVDGPCFDFSSLNRPMISMDIFNSTDEGLDGAVLQSSIDGGLTWQVVGDDSDAGIEWYNEIGIRGKPGDQLGGDFGWSENDTLGWKNVRHNLNNLRGQSRVRLRVAFGSNSDNPSNEQFDGFAFDNVWIGDKTRHVLTESFVNINNDTDSRTYLYSLFDTQQSNDSADFVMIEYRLSEPVIDSLNVVNSDDPEARGSYYGISETPSGLMNGVVLGSSVLEDNRLTLSELDQESLKDPLFEIKLDSVETSRNSIHIETTLTALDTLSDEVVVHLALVENRDNNQRAILRKLLYTGTGKLLDIDWNEGTQYSLTGNEAAIWDINLYFENPNGLGIVAFVQNFRTKEVYQAEYLKLNAKEQGAVVQTEEQILLANIWDMKLYPNPAVNQLTFAIDHEVVGDYQWKILDQRGVEVLEGELSFDDGPYTTDITSIPNGVYYVVIGAKDKPMMYKKIVVANKD